VDLRHALLLALASTPLCGCYLHCNHIPEERFMIQTTVSIAELEGLLSDYPDLESVEQLPCERVCEYTYEHLRSYKLSSVGVCDLDWPSEGADGATVSLACRGYGVEYFCKGRRPLGHVEHVEQASRERDAEAPLGISLAEMAELEAASVIAFEQLADQLRELDAPVDLIERCHAAADDERNHARWLTALASHNGASVRDPQLEPHANDLLTIALHNATEGCVHESFAALVAAVIANVSPSPVLRRIYARIAVDETGHGQLAWDLHEWLCDRLSPAERARVEAAQREALAQLPERVAWLAELPREFGPPSPSDARLLARNFNDALARADLSRLAARPNRVFPVADPAHGDFG
jgi:hypothetical protein